MKKLSLKTIFEAFLNEENEEVALERQTKVQLASNSQTSPEKLAELAKDKDFIVRAYVAWNTSTPKQLLRDLVNDSNSTWDILHGIARNSNSDADTLVKLSKSENWNVREGVASNQNVPKEALSILSSDEKWQIRHIVSSNFNTPIAKLRNLANDKNPNVSATAKSTIERLEQ